MFSRLQAPDDVTMNKTNPNITFVTNVNPEQSERGSEKQPNIQGNKDHLGENTKYQVLPKVKVDNHSPLHWKNLPSLGSTR